MIPRSAIAVITLLGVSWSHAQNANSEPKDDPVITAIREFNLRDSRKTNEVTVVLDSAGEPPAATQPDPAPQTDTPPRAPVLVTGKPPEDTTLIESAPPPSPSTQETDPEESTPGPRQGLNVRVEKIQSGDRTIDPAQVKLLAPFPAKPLAQPPAGWHFETAENTPPFTREVELSPGSKIVLTVRPHLLVPDADGTAVFTVQEPGFDNALGYRQTGTVGAILANSIRDMDEDAKKLGAAIDQLQQLLVSLPKPEPIPQATPVPVRKR